MSDLKTGSAKAGSAKTAVAKAAVAKAVSATATGGAATAASVLISRRRFLAGLATAAVAGIGAVPVLVGSMAPVHDGFAAPTAFALEDIPAEFLPLFFEAGDRHGITWSILAAVAWRESGWAPDVIACRRDSTAGARGLMQFMPATARGMGIDPCDPPQAIDGAARYLAGHLARFGSIELALAAYNAGGGAVARHGGIPPYAETRAYVPAVLERASLYADAYQDLTLVSDNVTGDPETLIELAAQGRVRLTSREITDLGHPAMDGRVIAVMEALAARWSYAVSVIKTGHSRCIGGGNRPGCSVSHHWHYRAVDIYMFDGHRVAASSATARSVVEFLAGLQGELRPSEVGSPFRLASPGHFSDADHTGHVHIGYGAAP